MTDYISRKAAISAVSISANRHQAHSYISEIPAADVRPVVHGEWLDCKGSNGNDYRKCSKCLHTQEITGLLNYCPVCGTDMREQEKDIICTKASPASLGIYTKQEERT